MAKNRWPKVVLLTVVLLLNLGMADLEEQRISLHLREVEISEVMEMLARQQRVNILLSEGVEGTLSLNLFEVSVDDAIRFIADAAGYAIEKKRGAYFVMEHEDVGRYTSGDLTSLRTFTIDYADPAAVLELVEPYLSRYGKSSVVEDRNLLFVSDTPEFLARIATLVRDVDVRPQQVLIEAQILEVTLNAEDSFGIDWTKIFESDGGAGLVGTQGFSGAGRSRNAGFFFDLTTPNIDAHLTALRDDGRMTALATPKLLTLDNDEASVIIGDRRGYAVTTTINQVTTESIEFLESGVILRVTPHIDAHGRILLDIHPEVSTGSVDAAGIPSQTTTEVTTRLLVPNGETAFIGGLIKHTMTQNYRRVPIIGNIPVIGLLFGSREKTHVNVETIVLITPRIVGDFDSDWNRAPTDRVREEWAPMNEANEHILRQLESLDAYGIRAKSDG
ncbi:MAG: hypothetical protein O7H39_14455 [Gammaproteobacteria bacterium]|nr:hypothetical protein [Gammaproteobacteria bacterium]